MKPSIYYGDGEGSIYTNEGKERLKKEENIVYTDGVFAFKAIERKGNSYLIELWTEDDGLLVKTDVEFDAIWLSDLELLIETTRNHICNLA